MKAIKSDRKLNTKQEKSGDNCLKRLMVVRWLSGEKSEGVKKNKLTVTK